MKEKSKKIKKTLTKKEKEIIGKAVHRAVQEYGETLKLLGKT